MSISEQDTICLVTALNDSTGELLEKAEKNWSALEQRFKHIAVHLTDSTNQA
ncbi:MAG: hypothetical protein VB957_08320 [Pseudomonadales bacterium]|jgi:hypothetical protein